MRPLFAKPARLLAALALGAALHALATPLVATNAKADCVTGVAGNDVLNIRSGPGTGYNIVGFIRPDECNIQTGHRSGNWTWVDYGKGGYVNSRYLTTGGQRGDAGSSFRCVLGVARNDVLNVRSRPSASSPIRGAIPPGACFIEIIDRSGRWYKVVYEGTRGWVNGRYLTD